MRVTKACDKGGHGNPEKRFRNTHVSKRHLHTFDTAYDDCATLLSSLFTASRAGL